MDGSYRRTVIQENGTQVRQHSFLTLLIYLNDDYEGGETLFYSNDDHCRYQRGNDGKTPRFTIKPNAGQALINIHNIVHEGSQVTHGVKYVLRTDVLFEKQLEVNPKVKQTGQKPGVSEWEKLYEPSCKNYHD